MTMGAFLLYGQFYKEEKIMKELENIKYVIFGFKDQETGNKLRLFFKKHTGRDVDFNSIKHYENGFKLLLFGVPLDTFDTVGITGACCAPSSVKRINGNIDELISWYEDDYLVFKDVEIIKHIPHASLDMPDTYKSDYPHYRDFVFGKSFVIDNLKMTDLFVDELFKDINGVTIKAPYSRLYCDVEKYLDNSKEPMFKFGQGYEYTKGISGNNYHRHSIINGMDPDNDVINYYQAHHNRLTLETKKILANNKKVLILDLHSYSDEQAKSINKEGPFPDICIGINDDSNNEPYLKIIIKKIKEKGYTYQINYPYSGSIIPNGLAKEELDNVCSIMIEVNKRIYL